MIYEHLNNIGKIRHKFLLWKKLKFESEGEHIQTYTLTVERSQLKRQG